MGPSADDYDILDILVNLTLKHKASHLGTVQLDEQAGRHRLFLDTGAAYKQTFLVPA